MRNSSSLAFSLLIIQFYLVFKIFIMSKNITQVIYEYIPFGNETSHSQVQQAKHSNPAFTLHCPIYPSFWSNHCHWFGVSVYSLFLMELHIYCYCCIRIQRLYRHASTFLSPWYKSALLLCSQLTICLRDLLMFLYIALLHCF